MSNSFEKVVDLAVLMYQEASYKDIPSNRNDIKESLLGLKEQDASGDGYFSVLYSGEEPVGFLVATIVPRHIIWGEMYKVAAELAWYVHPAYRKQGAASQLIDQFEQWCKNNNIDIIVNAVMHNDSYDQVKDLYEKRGYTAAETAYIKRIKQ